MMVQFSIKLLTNLRVEPLSGAHSAINGHLMKENYNGKIIIIIIIMIIIIIIIVIIISKG